jgi:hypothetical protein
LRVPQRGRRDARTLADDDGGRGVARGNIRSRAKCDVVDDSWQLGFQYCRQLDAAHGADRHGVFRGVEYNLNNIPTLHNNVDRNAAVQP